jgi:hypothetical protein
MRVLGISFCAFALALGAFFLGMVFEGFRRTGDSSILWHWGPLAWLVVMAGFVAVVTSVRNFGNQR